MRQGTWGHQRRRRHAVNLLCCALVATLAAGHARADAESSTNNRPTREHIWVLESGYTTIALDMDQLAAAGLKAKQIGYDLEDAARAERSPRIISLSTDPGSRLIVEEGPDGINVVGAELRHSGGFALKSAGAAVSMDNMIIGHDPRTPSGELILRSGSSGRSDGLFLWGITIQVDPISRTATMWTDEATLTPYLARQLGVSAAQGRAVAKVSFEGRFRRIVVEDGVAVEKESLLDVASLSRATAGASVGPDVIVISLQSVANYGSKVDPVTQERISAYSVGTTSCNIGDEPAIWIPATSNNSNQHPVIAQHLYRLKDGRFEQIGISWVKHGFFAVNDDACGNCIDPPGINGQRLGVGCSDPYGANLNAQQNNLGPRSPVNAFTGFFPVPFDRMNKNDNIDRRLQVRHSDVDPAQNAGALYFIEGHYVTPDDAAARNDLNNASYRPAVTTLASPGNNFCLNPADISDTDVCIIANSTTRTQEPAIRAWKVNDNTVQEAEAFVPGEGYFRVSAKVSDLGNGFWHYEYAVYNMNSHRSGGSFRVPIPLGASVQNIGFHAPFSHSGEPYDNLPWTAVVGDDAVVWSTQLPFEQNPNANALRWGTLYNFWMDVNLDPEPTSVTIGLFRPGTPTVATAQTVGPRAGVIDCNGNEVNDPCDLSCDVPGCEEPCGGSLDCNENEVPDECEPDCNENSVADECDIRDMTSPDCDGNNVPDECDPDCDDDGTPDACEADLDVDDDGVPDCDDLCPATTPPGACFCPARDLCCYGTGFCIPDFPRNDCISQGGTPACQASPCRNGCLVGDWDLDGDRDLFDVSMMLECFSGFATVGYERPSAECLLRFDFDSQDDVDVDDFRKLRDEMDGP